MTYDRLKMQFNMYVPNVEGIRGNSNIHSMFNQVMQPLKLLIQTKNLDFRFSIKLMPE
jgi:hypothetical protein